MFFTKQSAEISRLRQENAVLREQIDTLKKYILKLLHRKPRIKTHDAEMNLAAIKVPKYFTPPRPENLAACEAFYKQYGVLDRKIIIHRGYCIDGYIGLLTLRAAGVETAKVLVVTI